MRPWPLLLIPAITLAAQAAKLGTGTVTGHISCADTNAPARRASVYLESVKDARQHRNSTDEPDGAIIQTTLDGSFVIPNVLPGAYYVVATAAGYLPSRPNDEDADEPEPRAPAGQPPVAAPRVDVQADQTANIDVRLERGAAVSGTIRFDDGSPAARVLVFILHRTKDTWVPPRRDPSDVYASCSLMTDDLGHYRIGGLRDGEYILQATLRHLDLVPADPHGDSAFSGAMPYSLAIYSGDTMRRSQAVPFKLGAGEERASEDITIPLSKMHFISGVVTAAGDGHVLRSANLQLEDPKDTERIVVAAIGTDGTFHLEGVPEGTFILRVTDASDKQEPSVEDPEQRITAAEDKTLHPYADLEQSIKIDGDIPNLVLSVPEKSTSQSSPHSSASQ